MTSEPSSDLQYTALRWLSLLDIPVQHLNLIIKPISKTTIGWTKNLQHFLFFLSTYGHCNLCYRLQQDFVWERMRMLLANPCFLFVEGRAWLFEKKKDRWTIKMRAELKKSWNDSSSNKWIDFDRSLLCIALMCAQLSVGFWLLGLRIGTELWKNALSDYTLCIFFKIIADRSCSWYIPHGCLIKSHQTARIMSFLFSPPRSCMLLCLSSLDQIHNLPTKSKLV